VRKCELDGVGYRPSKGAEILFIEGGRSFIVAFDDLRGRPPFGFGLFLEESALPAVLGSCVNLPAMPFLYPPNEGPRIRLVRPGGILVNASLLSLYWHSGKISL
jgi:hypothetical protein